MSLYIKKLFFSLVLLPSVLSYGQAYKLEPGEQYRLSQSYTQNTYTESLSTSGNVSLDINSSVIIEIMEKIDSTHYTVECQYDNISLSLFSTNMNIALSSETNSFSLIKKYLNLLEEYKFKATLSRYGEISSIDSLDEYILSFYHNPEKSLNEQDIVIKTLSEAFGEDAFNGFINLVLNVYCDSPDDRCSKDIEYSFNAKPILLHNSFFSQLTKDGERRVQGLGMINANDDEMEFDGGTVTTSLTGKQTYDYLFDNQTGWLIEGNSRQKIYLLSVFRGNKNLPEGLEIPSLTETEFQFSGEKIVIGN